MRRNVSECRAKAQELDRVADEVANYETMLVFDSIAETWRAMAAYWDQRAAGEAILRRP
jgi:hypothetical protein